MSICRARWVGSRVCFRCGWIRCDRSRGALAGGPALGQALKWIKEQLRAIPDNGLGYGLLRYLNAQTGAQLACDAAPQLGFNYLGRMASEAGDWSVAAEATGGGGDLAMPLAHALEINALTLDQPDGARLRANWSWARALLTETMYANWLRAGSDACGAGGMWRNRGRAAVARDLPLVSLTQAEIERLEREYPQLEDILPLSPLQEGLLFHSLYDTQAPDVYTVQLDLELVGALDGAALAAQALIERHASLRACFQHEQSGRPVQIMRRGFWLPGAQSICRVRGNGARTAAGRHPDAGSCRTLRCRVCAAVAICADPAFDGSASSGADPPSSVDGRLVCASVGAGAAHALWAAGRGAAAGYALPRLSGIHREAGSWRCAHSLAGSPGGTGGTDAAGAACGRRCTGCA